MTSEEVIVLKRLLRQKIRNRLQLLSHGDARKKSILACEKILTNTDFRRFSNLMIYMALPGELDLTLLAKKAIEQGKAVYFPKVNVEKKELEIFRVYHLDSDLRRGAFGIQEPYRTQNRLKDIKELECILVPGIVFDADGGRIGRGAGFYDRFLSHRDFFKIGVAFSEQMVSEVPRTSHDISMDKVIHA